MIDQIQDPTESERSTQTVRETWPFSLEKMRVDMARYKADHQETLIALFIWCIDERHPVKRLDAAVRIGVSPNLLYQLYTGVYRNPDKTLRNPSEETIRLIREFLKLEAERFQLGDTDFVMTPTAQKIFTACNLARESQTPVIMWGPSQIGKTFGLRQYQQTHNHGKTFMAELEAAAGVGGLLRVMCLSVGYKGTANPARLVAKIKNSLTPNSLLILDEMHLLKHTYQPSGFFKCVEVIRRIHDFCRCGMLLSWTNINELEGASQTELIQLWRRGVHKVALPLMPTKSDLEAVLKHNGLDFPEKDLEIVIPQRGKEPIREHPYQVLRQQAKEFGLKSITERIRYARKIAGRDDGKLSWHHFIDAHTRIDKQSKPDPIWD